MSSCPVMGRLISTATLLAYVIVHFDGAAHMYCFSVSICLCAPGLGGSYIQLLCKHMSSCPWIGRLISSATLLAYVLVYLDGAAHIYCFSVGICPRALGWGASYLQLLC
ncbi:hypothetical protein DPMN_009385 [Dreissena polymorpha]|uniref:Uncharacterized protein n=1 Tax=Dreissena polymorpha TaxID=45954 RepID=A0A9D4S0J5_DREPO|nr:hypothetical protein DPMN_009385 [Dreissena polymorpha]